MKGIEKSIGEAATQIANDIDANCIISVEKKIKEEFEDINEIDVKVTVFKKVRKGVYSKNEYSTKVRKVSGGSIVPVKDLLIEAINKKYINKGDRVVCVQDESMGTGYRGLLFVFDVDKVFFDISKHHLTDNINSEVIESIINLALEIGREGREGKKIGTAFVIGDKNEIMKYSKQMIINPFSGYDGDVRNITDPSMKDTIKEFAQLDGIFMIDKEGVILSAGTYINIDAKGINFPGLGTRHLCCAALTNKVDSIAVVVSESGGNVVVFKNGKGVMKLP